MQVPDLPGCLHLRRLGRSYTVLKPMPSINPGIDFSYKAVNFFLFAAAGMFAPGAVGLAVAACLWTMLRDSPTDLGYPPIEQARRSSIRHDLIIKSAGVGLEDSNYFQFIPSSQRIVDKGGLLAPLQSHKLFARSQMT